MSIDRDRGALDAMVRDACEQQMLNGVMPTPEPVRDAVVPFIEQMERRRADRPTGKTAKSDAAGNRASRNKREGAIESEYERRSGRKLEGEYGIDRNMKPSIEKPVSRDAGAYMVLERLRLLKRYPEWEIRLRGLVGNSLGLELAGHYGPERKREVEFKMRQVLLDSERVFGPIFKQPERKIILS